jgi:proteasome lid subunit RPN8/RPN11
LFISMSNKLHEELLTYCRSQWPKEACGFIEGKQIGHDLRAESIRPVSNCSMEPLYHFEMDPIEFVSIISKPSDEMKLIGIFHSHPSAEAVPSDEDLKSMWHHIPSYWIVSLLNPTHPNLQIFQIKKAPLTYACKLSHAIDQ